MTRAATVVRGLFIIGVMLTTLAFGNTNKTIVTRPSEFAVTPRVADLPIELSLFPGIEMPEPKAGPLRANATPGPVGQKDPALQTLELPQFGGSKGIDFDGIASNGYAPSDSNMAVGPNHIVETVNVLFAVFNKSGALLAGPTSIGNLFSGLSLCASTYGDPVVLYDRPPTAGWSAISERRHGITSECVAVSKTNDPTGAYYVYGYSFGTNLNDYPKLSTWATATNSAYLATYDIFVGFGAFGGSDLCGLDRTKMLAGNSARHSSARRLRPASLATCLPIWTARRLPSTAPPDFSSPGRTATRANSTCAS